MEKIKDLVLIRTRTPAEAHNESMSLSFLTKYGKLSGVDLRGHAYMVCNLGKVAIWNHCGYVAVVIRPSNKQTPTSPVGSLI
jgi:hypothetical protein